jgi:exosortase
MIMLAIGMIAVAAPTMRLVAKASWSTEQGAHGPIVLATGLWLIWRMRHLAAERMRPAPLWSVVLLMAVLLPLYVFARITQIIEVEGYVMYAVLLTAIYSVIGLQAMKRLWFPFFYLLFIFPPPDTLVAMVTQPLKIWISQAAIHLLHALGYPIGGAGVTIQIGQYQLLVAAACSGLNSIISLSAITLFYIYIRHQADLRYGLLLSLLILPVAILANFVRVLILILITYYFGEAAAQGFLHSVAGLTMFVIALLSIFAADSLIQPLWRRLNKAPEPEALF